MTVSEPNPGGINPIPGATFAQATGAPPDTAPAAGPQRVKTVTILDELNQQAALARDTQQGQQQLGQGWETFGTRFRRRWAWTRCYSCPR